jgi:CHAT domain-containing protein
MWVAGRIRKSRFRKKDILLFFLLGLFITSTAHADVCPEPTEKTPYVKASILAHCYKQAEDYPQAEHYYKESLDAARQDLPENHPDIAKAMDGLAKLYADWGKNPEQAEKLFRDSIEIFRQQPVQYIDIVEPLTNLADFYLTQPNDGEAETLYKQALDILRQVPERESTRLSIILNNLAQYYRLHHRYGKAESLFKESLALDRKTLPPTHPNIGTTLYNLANNAHDQDKPEEAGRYYQQSLSIRQQSLPEGHPDIARTLARMAKLEEDQGNLPKALALMEKAAASYKHPLPLQPAPENTLTSQQTSNMQDFARLQLRLLQQSRQYHLRNDADILPEAFQAIQQAHGAERMRLLLQAALRLSSSGSIHDQIQQLWSLQTRHQDLEKQYLTALGEKATKSAELTDLRTRIARTETDIRQLDKTLKQTFPAYAQLINPEPLSLAKTESLLAADEALMVWVIDEKGSFLYVVRPNQTPGLYPLDIGRNCLEHSIDALLAPIQSAGEDMKKTGHLRDFDLPTAHRLYKALFAPAENGLKGVKHIVAITDDTLQRLPLSVLVKNHPNSATDPSGSYDQTDWLLNDYAFSYLPAVHSLADLRVEPSRPLAGQDKRQPFIGFGDPILHEPPVQLSRLFASRGAGNTRGNIPDFVTDTSGFKNWLPSLPDTADELDYIADLLGADKSTSLYLREKATESEVKQLSREGKLHQFRFISFATHALLPDKQNHDLPSLEESGLVLTPPERGTEEDDGYLSASEAASLDINADWVLLSACNTGTSGRNGRDSSLSELAKAFFTAGSRSVLASQWAVDSSVTRELMGSLFEKLNANRHVRRAEALRLAMQEIARQPPKCGWLCQLHWQPETQPAHPVYWAPFMVYGEGGASTH